MVHKPATKELTEAHEERDVLVAATPLTFDEFTNFFDEDDEVELIDGVVVKQMAARDPPRKRIRLAVFSPAWLCNGKRAWRCPRLTDTSPNQ